MDDIKPEQWSSPAGHILYHHFWLFRNLILFKILRNRFRFIGDTYIRTSFRSFQLIWHYSADFYSDSTVLQTHNIMANKFYRLLFHVWLVPWMEREMKIHSFTNMNNEQEHFHLWINDNDSISPTFTTHFSLLKCIETTTMGCYARKIFMHSLALSQIAHTRPLFFPLFFFSFFVLILCSSSSHTQNFCHFATLVLCNHHSRWALSIEHDQQHFPKITFHINEASFSL